MFPFRNAEHKTTYVRLCELRSVVLTLLFAIVPADGVRLPFLGSGEFGTSPFFGSSQSRQSA